MRNVPPAEYRIETAPLDANGFSLYEKIFAHNGMPRQEGMLDWRYIKNPAGAGSILDFAFKTETNELGSVYAVMGVNLWHRSKIVPGLQSLDTLTDTAHRRRGLFPLLAKHAYSRARDTQCSAVYGFPNQNSYPTFEGHLGWTIFGVVDFMFRPLRSGYFLRRLFARARLGSIGGLLDVPFPAYAPPPGDWSIRPIERFSKKHEDLWREVAQTVTIAVDRSADYLNWRLFERPDGDKYCLFEATENGKVVGFVVWCVEEKHGGRIGYLMECLVCPNRTDVMDALLRYATHSMYLARADLVLAWAPPHQTVRSALTRVWFRPLPISMRPTQLFWGALSLRADTSFEAKDWYISYLDSDTV